MTWQVTIWAHDGDTRTVDSDGSETIDELIHKAGFKAQDVNGMDIQPVQGGCNAPKERRQ